MAYSTLPKAFACYNKKRAILKKSSSGGVFYALASSIINDYSGIVYGSVIVNGDVFHARTDSLNGLLPMMGSKYVRSELRNTYSECKVDLEKGKYVLFSGTPCQINALHFYLDRLNINKEKLISVDVICHGTPKPYYWKKYLELNFKSKDISNISFRYKKEGWENYYIKVGDYESPFSNDPYMKAFLENKILFESCFNCQCKGENRKADITLGDFWGIGEIDHKLKNKNGTSIIIIRNSIDFVLSILRSKCVVNEVPYLSSIYTNLPYYKSIDKPISCNIIDEHLTISNSSINTDSKKREGILRISKQQINHLKKTLFCRTPNIYTNRKKRKNNNKVAIITDFGYTNYGNRLQNYALLTILRKIGEKPINICYFPKGRTLFRCLLRRYHNYQDDKINNSIYKSSRSYERKIFNFSRFFLKQRKMCNFETVIIGSDQVWNPDWHKNDELRFFLGDFGINNPPYKLISYSASICTRVFDYEQKMLFKNLLKSFDKVSVREISSCKLLSEIGINAINVVDPTLLLGPDEWCKAIDVHSTYKLPTDEYIFICVFNDELLEHNIVNRYKGIPIIKCYGKHSSDSIINQFDFVNIIKNASHVITDSFHAVIFSIIFKKKTTILNRGLFNMNIRIEDFFTSIGFAFQYNKEIDFSLLDYSILNNWISNSKTFLFNEFKK